MLPSLLIMWSEKAALTAFIMGVSYLVMLSVTIWKDWFVVPKKITIISLWAAAVFLWEFWIYYLRHWGAPYQMERIEAVSDPYGAGAGYAASAMKTIISGSRLFGTKEGFAGDVEGIAYTGDYTLSLICGYYGVLTAVILVVSILLLLLYFLHMSFGQRNQLGMIMGMGCSVVFLVEFFLYILGNTGRLPGVSYCPFLGYGGTGMMIDYILMGILLSVYRYEHVASEVKIEKRTYAKQED